MNHTSTHTPLRHRLAHTVARTLSRLVLLALACGAAGLLTACGGGGGSGGTNPAVGALTVVVTDKYSAPVAGAHVVASLGSSSVVGLTDGNGQALLAISWPDGTATIDITREAYLDATLQAPIVAGKINTVSATLTRITLAAGGSMLSRSGVPPLVSNGGRTLDFEVELVVVDSDANPVEGLDASAFRLLACTPDAATAVNDCVRGATSKVDLAYTPVDARPEVEVVGTGVAQPYAAALMIDQSASISVTDPTSARLYSAKSFIDELGDRDQVLLAAFAEGAGAVLPTMPLSVWDPFRDRSTASEYFAVLDELSPLVGGATPLYMALDTMRARLASDPTLPSDLGRAIVLFTDGTDTLCGAPDACRSERQQIIDAASADGIRIFTIGLSDDVDIESLGEMSFGTGGAVFYAETAPQLIPLYGSVGRLLSLSLGSYRLRFSIQADVAGSFVPGQVLLGKVEVTITGRTFIVPFIVPVL
jgi:hypothetical protein